jgi:hypothetical protein
VDRARVASGTVLAVALLAAGPAAAAPTYDQYACRAPGGRPASADGFVARSGGGSTAATVDQCAAGGGLDAALAAAGAAGWRYAPPPGTSIAAVSIRRRVTIPPGSGATYELAGADDRCDAASACGESLYDLGVPAGGLDFRLACPVDACGGGGRLSIEAVRISLADPALPQVTGMAVPEGPLRGVQTVSYTAADTGGGVYEAALVVDGTERERRPAAPRDRACRRPFVVAVPCPPQVRGSLLLDTRALAVGPHTVGVAVYDATGANRAVSEPVGVVVAERAAAVSERAPAPLALLASRTRLRNGQSLSLSARLPVAVPAGTARVAFQVLIAGRWRTFAVRPMGAGGRARVRHRFHATFRRLRYRFRAVIRGDRRFPFAAGRSRAVSVLVN